MLPKYEYDHYYDELCQFCENEMVTPDEGGECTDCKEVICEDCRNELECAGCAETICEGCVGYCNFCSDLRFCEECLGEHEQECTRMSRAERHLETLTESLESKLHERARLRQRLRELAQELEDIEELKEDAEDLVRELHQRGF